MNEVIIIKSIYSERSTKHFQRASSWTTNFHIPNATSKRYEVVAVQCFGATPLEP